MMRRSALRTFGLCAAAVLMVSCSENSTGPSGAGVVSTVQVRPQMVVTAGSNMLISQVYGGGGNSGAQFTNDFVELLNAGTVTADIGNWSVQYASAAGTSWAATTIPAGTMVQPGHYFLIQLAAGSTAAAALPTPDRIGTTNMSGTAGKVVLSQNTAAVTGGCPASADVIDHAAYGSITCGASEAVWTRAPTLTNATAAVRKGAGCTNTNDNASDFLADVPQPRNSASVNVCGVVVSQPASVSISPSSATIDIGATQAFIAMALDAGGNTVATTMTWSSSNSAVATVTTGGVVTGVSEGTATITATTANNVSNTAAVTVNVPPVVTAPDIVISQIYGGGGNTGATYNRDFVELFNRGTSAVAIGGWSVQYSSATGTSWTPAGISPNTTLQPGQYFLVALASGTVGVALPTPDTSASSPNLSASAGKVLLSRTIAGYATACPSDANVVDHVSFGGTANCNAVWGATTAPSNNTTAMLRADAGCTWTGATVSDFAVAAVAPRNRATPRHPCHAAATDPVSVGVTPPSVTVQVANTVTLAATALDANGQTSPTTYTWASSNNGFATVSATGVVTGVAPGIATVTATSANGVAGTATVTVTAAPPAASGIVISEILADPDVVTDAQGEWFEVFNTSAVAVDLQGWEIRSARSTGPDETHVIASSVIVPAGGFAVLGNNGNSATNGGVAVSYVFPSDVITLSNGSNTEWLVLHTTLGVTADSVAYSPRNASGTVIDPKFLPTVGVARELVDVSGDNSAMSSSNWRDAVLPFGTGSNRGTPGYGAYGVAGPVARIVISPSPASVNLGGTRAMNAIAIDALGRISNEALTWSISNQTVATISANGIVSGLVTGSATITAQAASGVFATTSLVVVDPDAPANITVSISDPGWIPAGFQRSVFSTVRTADNRIVTASLVYTVSDPSVITLDVYAGRTYVRGVGAGTAELRGTAPNGAFGIRTVTILPATAATSAVYRNHIEFGMPTDGDSGDDIIVSRPEFISSYNSLRGGPNWVSWNLNASHFGPAPRCNCFSVDQTLPVGAYRVTDVDYINSGYDRGHMVQSESRTSTEQANAATFALTNILPQAALNNQQVWLAFENFLNDQANAGRDVYIVAGGEYAGNPTTLKGEGKVAIPDFTWKIAVVMPGGQGLAGVTSRQSMQVYVVRMPNLLSTATGGSNWQQYQTTVDAIEAATQYDFLAALPDAIERVVESNNHAPVVTDLAPVAGIEWTPIQFTGVATDVDANDALTFSWSFGDGISATGATASHTYDNAGTYAVQLIVTDSYGEADTASTTATVAAAPAPTATFHATETVIEGSAVSLSLTDVTSSIGSIVTFSFDCGSGYGAFGDQSSVTCPATTDNGAVTVRGRVQNQRGTGSEYTAAATVTNAAPTASLMAPSSVTEGSLISVSLGTVTDAGIADVAAGFTYAFDCGTGYGAFGSSASGSCSTSDDGTRTIKASVRDKDGGTTEYTADVVVTNAAPVLAAFAGSTILAGETFAATGSFTDTGADTWTGSVNYGTGAVALPLAGMTFALSNSYAVAGSYILTVTITDDDGGADARTATVIVQTPAQGANSLTALIAQLQANGSIPSATAQTLIRTSDAAALSLAGMDNPSGINQMGAFKNQVDAALKSGKISAATAATLNAMADRIIASAKL